MKPVKFDKRLIDSFKELSKQEGKGDSRGSALPIGIYLLGKKTDSQVATEFTPLKIDPGRGCDRMPALNQAILVNSTLKWIREGISTVAMVMVTSKIQRSYAGMTKMNGSYSMFGDDLRNADLMLITPKTARLWRAKFAPKPKRTRYWTDPNYRHYTAVEVPTELV
jgi:hypothetical protein